MNYCIFHANCLDGLASAVLVGRYLRGEEVEFIPAHYDDPFPEHINGGTVYIVDFSYPPEVLMDSIHKVDKLVMIDHHASAESKYQPHMLSLHKYTEHQITFDTSESGASLVNRVLLNNSAPYDAAIEFLKEYDTFTFTDPKVVTLATYLKYIYLRSSTNPERIKGYIESFEGFMKIYSGSQEAREKYMKTALEFEKYEHVRLSKLIQDSKVLRMGKWGVLVGQFHKDEVTTVSWLLGNGKIYPEETNWLILATEFKPAQMQMVYHLRSTNPKEIPILPIASEFGGGGHPGAGGITTDDLTLTPRITQSLLSLIG